ncbi:MAG: hypothetical protein WBB28_20810 [Crinalium sp.]
MELQLKGEVEIRVIDATTGEIKSIQKQSNLIPDETLRHILRDRYYGYGGHFTPGIFAELRIGISTSTVPPRKDNYLVDAIAAVGFIATGVVSPKIFPAANPPYGQIQNRILFIGAVRSFRTIFLTAAASNDNYASPQTQQAYAYTLLDLPCTQGVNDILELFYRIQVVLSPGAGLNLSSRASSDFLKALFGKSYQGYASQHWQLYFIGNTSTSPASPPAANLGYKDLFYGFNEITSLSGQDSAGWEGRTTPIFFGNYFKTKLGKNFSQDFHVGRLFNLLLQGLSDPGNSVEAGYYAGAALASRAIFPPDRSPAQVKFSHSSDATMPFYDPQKLAFGSGVPNFSGNWSSLYPQMFRISIVATGNVGTSTYKIAVRPTFGYAGNTWNDEFVFTPFRNPMVPAAPGMHGWQIVGQTKDYTNNSCQDLRYSDTEIVQYDSTGVTKLDIMSGNFSNWDATTVPALPVTDIAQVACVPGGNIYVACRTAGLFQISANAVTLLSATPCYAVDVGRNNRVFAFFSDRLSCSDDWTAALDFSSANLPPADYTKINYLKVDPEHLDDQMLIVHSPVTNNVKMTWWAMATGIAIAQGTDWGYPPDYDNIRRPRCLDVSDTGSFWAFFGQQGYPRKLTYGLAQHFDFRGGSNEYPPGCGINFIGDKLILRDKLVDITGAVVPNSTFNDLHTGGAIKHLLHMGDGIVLDGYRLRYLFAGRGGTDTTAWKEYGWDGLDWVLGNAGAKATHADAQALPPKFGGLSIAFAEGTTTPSFNAGDYYTQAYCKGVLKSNREPLSIESSFYLKPLLKNQSISGTVPATGVPALIVNASPYGSDATLKDPAFAAFEADAVNLHSITIAGYADPATILRNRNTAPAPNQISANFQSGALTFNDGDRGKAVTGSYGYVTGADPAVYPAVHPELIYPEFKAVFDFDLNTVVDASNRVVSVTDQTSYSGNADGPADDTRKPLLVANAINSKSAIRFDHVVGNYLKLPTPGKNILPSKGMTSFMLLKLMSGHGGQCLYSLGGSLIDNQGNSADANRDRCRIWLYYNGGTFGINMLDANTGNYGDRYFTTNTATSATNLMANWALVTVIQGWDGMVNFRLNGANFGDTTFGLAQDFSRRYFTIGALGTDNGAGFDQWLNALVGYFGFANASLSIAEAQQVEKIIAGKFGLSSILV